MLMSLYTYLSDVPRRVAKDAGEPVAFLWMSASTRSICCIFSVSVIVHLSYEFASLRVASYESIKTRYSALVTRYYSVIRLKNCSSKRSKRLLSFVMISAVSVDCGWYAIAFL